jgi:hypothetical protein
MGKGVFVGTRVSVEMAVGSLVGIAELVSTGVFVAMISIATALSSTLSG